MSLLADLHRELEHAAEIEIAKAKTKLETDALRLALDVIALEVGLIEGSEPNAVIEAVRSQRHQLAVCKGYGGVGSTGDQVPLAARGW